MKRHSIISAIALIAAISALAGCSSNEADSVTSIALGEDAAETEIAADLAFVTAEAEPQTLTEPPQLQVIYSGDGLAYCAAMTLGNYEWSSGDTATAACGADALTAAQEGLVGTDVDLDLIADGEPKINLCAGAEITAVTYYPTSGEAETALEYTSDGVITFPETATDGAVSVAVTYPQGTAEYFFTVSRSQTDLSEPPALRVYLDEIGFEMTKAGCTWTTMDGDEAQTISVDCPTPWQSYESGADILNLSLEPQQEITVALPSDAAITSAVYYTSEDDKHELAVNGNKVTLPSEELSGVCCIDVEMKQGSCEYFFSFQTGGSSSTAAYDPSQSE